MSLSRGLFCFPFYALYGAYQALNIQVPLDVEFPLEDKNGSSIQKKTLYKGDPLYQESLQFIPGMHIKHEMQSFLDKFGVRKDLIIGASVPRPEPIFAYGVSRYQKSDIMIGFRLRMLDYYAYDKDAFTWLMKHEISHIIHDDGFTSICVSGACQLAATIYGMHSLSFWTALGLSHSMGAASFISYRIWREAKADDFAIENSSAEELLGGRRFMKTMQEVNRFHRNSEPSLIKQTIISSSGEYRLDILHPSLTHRIQKIERALLARQIIVNEEDDREKILLGRIYFV